MASSEKVLCSSEEPKITSGNVANTLLLCGLCEILKMQLILLECCGKHLCQDCSKKVCPIDRRLSILSSTKTARTPNPKSKNVVKMSADHGVERDSNAMMQIECNFCPWKGSSHDYLQHARQFHERFECADCHAHFPTTSSYEVHRQDTSEYRCIPCPLRDCDKTVKVCEMGKHYLSEKHQESLIRCIRKIQSIRTQSLVSNVTHDINQVSTGTHESVDVLSSRSVNFANDRVQQSIECTQTQTIDQSIVPNFNGPLLLSADGDIVFPLYKDHDQINSLFSLHSPTFRTSNFGYVFQLRVCSTLRPTHHEQDYLSIYLTLYSSPYDPILVYPFPYNISLYLRDQSGEGRDIEATIKADPGSPAFAQPSGEKNADVGVTKFCPLDYLTKNDSIYFKGGVFFIRVFFDFMNISSNMNN